MPLFRGRYVVGLLAGLALVGCGPREPHVLGVAPASEKVVTMSEAAKAPAAQKIKIEGEMVEKCPAAGCWFVLRDKTGTLRVDTKGADFVVTDVPLRTTMTVAGKIVQGETPTLAATGARY